MRQVSPIQLVHASVRGMGRLHFFSERVGCLGNSFELVLALKVEQDGRLFYLAAFEDSFNDFVAVERLVGVF